MTKRLEYDHDLTLLLTPGPVQLHPRVLRALASPVVYHRGEPFASVLKRVADSIGKIEGTDNLTIPITGSGTAAMDMALSSMVKRNSRVLTLVNGVFSARLDSIARYYSDNVTTLQKEWGKAIKATDVRSALEGKSFDFVTVVHNETSTGVVNPLKEIMDEVRKTGAISIVDGITSVGGDVVRVDDWGIDAMITASQKCLGGPPGISFLTLSERALDLIRKGDRGQSYYLDVRNYLKGSGFDVPFTTATPLVVALDEAIRLIEEEGLENRIRRHKTVAKSVRDGIRAMGLELLAEAGYESNTVTAIKLKDAGAVISKARGYGVLFAEGQGKLSGSLLRFGHMNLVGKREVLLGLSVLDAVLTELGLQHEAGKATDVAAKELVGLEN